MHDLDGGHQKRGEVVVTAGRREEKRCRREEREKTQKAFLLPHCPPNCQGRSFLCGQAKKPSLVESVENESATGRTAQSFPPFLTLNKCLESIHWNGRGKRVELGIGGLTGCSTIGGADHPVPLLFDSHQVYK
jgi:hypothetical protein